MNNPWHQIFFFENEDADALKARFAELWAKWGDRFSLLDYAFEVFKNLPDAQLRAGQAAILWDTLDMREQVKEIQINGASKPLTREQWDIRVSALTENDKIGHNDKKAALDGYRLYAEAQGWIVKSITSKSSVTADGSAGDFLAALAAKLPA